MGIRIHKMLGYGLTDVRTKKFTIADPRFNPKFVENLADWTHTIEEFCHFVEKASSGWEDRILPQMIREQGIPLRESPFTWIHHDAEFGLPKVLCVVPPDMCSQCNRYDDLIDWTEESQNNGSINRVQLLPSPHFPYNGTFMNRASGERYTGEQRDIAGFFHRWSRGSSPNPTLARACAKRLGFSTVREAKKTIVPWVPTAVTLLCKFLKMFREESTVFQLRPMLYVYWS
jgi:hypothetical protein